MSDTFKRDSDGIVRRIRGPHRPRDLRGACRRVLRRAGTLVMEGMALILAAVGAGIHLAVVITACWLTLLAFGAARPVLMTLIDGFLTLFTTLAEIAR